MFMNILMQAAIYSPMDISLNLVHLIYLSMAERIYGYIQPVTISTVGLVIYTYKVVRFIIQVLIIHLDYHCIHKVPVLFQKAVN